MQQHMKKRFCKFALDLVLLVLLALMYQKRVISMRFHELGGLALFGLFVLHKVLNWAWIASTTGGILRRRIKLNPLWLVDLLLLVSMTCIIITGLLISKTLPTAIEGGFGLKAWHYFFSSLSIVLTGVHLGLHWPLLRRAIWDRIPLSGRFRTVTGALVLCAVVCGGLFALSSTSILSRFVQPFSNSMPQYGNMSFPQEGGGADGELSMTEAPQDGQMTQQTEQDSRPEDGGQISGENGEMPAGFDKMRGGPMGDEKISISNVMGTLGTYASCILMFAALTALLQSRIRILKKGKPKKSAAPPAADAEMNESLPR